MFLMDQVDCSGRIVPDNTDTSNQSRPADSLDGGVSDPISRNDADDEGVSDTPVSVAAALNGWSHGRAEQERGSSR